MQEFIEKWKNEPRFKTKVKLGLYTLFVVIVAIFALSNRGTIYSNTSHSDSDIIIDDPSIEIPDAYNYTINVAINTNIYTYSGTKNKNSETITKTVEDVTHKYIYQDGRYYKESIVINNIISKEEVYDIIDYNYINLDTINKYLSLSKEDNGTYVVYLKDIIIGHESDEYITITKNKNQINIDYTSLMKLFDKTIESSLIEVIIEEIE